jgi:hypothetical protein
VAASANSQGYAEVKRTRAGRADGCPAVLRRCLPRCAKRVRPSSSSTHHPITHFMCRDRHQRGGYPVEVARTRKRRQTGGVGDQNNQRSQGCRSKPDHPSERRSTRASHIDAAIMPGPGPLEASECGRRVACVRHGPFTACTGHGASRITRSATPPIISGRLIRVDLVSEQENDRHNLPVF